MTRTLLTLLALSPVGSAATPVPLEGRTSDVEGVEWGAYGVTVSHAGAYVLSGRLVGQVRVHAPAAEVTLVLADVSVHNPDGPAVLVTAANAVTIELAPGTVNRLSDGGSSEYDAALYSEAPLTITGDGELEVTAIYEGIASTTHITLLSGTVRVVAGEDGLNANRDGVSRIAVRGGYLYARGLTGDGIDSNGSLEISGGTVVAIGSFEAGEGGLDADLGIVITGGTVVATGTRAPIPLSTPGDQAALILDFERRQRSGGLTVVAREDGDPLFGFLAPDDFGQLVYSAPDVRHGEKFEVYTGGTSGRAETIGLVTEVTNDGRLLGTVRAGHLWRVPAGPCGEGSPNRRSSWTP